MIDTATNGVVATIRGRQPNGLVITPNGARAYVTNNPTGASSVSVLNVATNTAIASVGIGVNAQLLAVTPDGRHLYVACLDSHAVFVIDTATNTVSATVNVGSAPVGVAIRPLVYQTRAPVADAYVRAGAFASTNFGTSSKLLAKKGLSADNTFRTYMTFDVGDVGAFGRAALRMTGRVSSSVTSSITVAVYAVADTTWQEHAVTWNTRPDLGAVLGTLTVAGVAPRSREIDLTKFLIAERAAGHTRITLALRSVVHTSAGAVFNSHDATSEQPQLLIGR